MQVKRLAVDRLGLIVRRLLNYPALVVAISFAVMFQPAQASGDPGVAVLCYHRFGPTVADSMTVKTSTFEAQLNWLRQEGYHVIPLRELIDYLLGTGEPPPEHSVVITVDDGHRTVYSEMLPIITKYDVPVTLFIYPSAISNASYALTWDQLRQMIANKNIEVQSHTYWHPNFDKERKRLSPADFTSFAELQLRKSKTRLQQELSKTDRHAGLAVRSGGAGFGECLPATRAMSPRSASCGAGSRRATICSRCHAS